ncbi:transmembrane protein 184A [Tanacetum coccineum]
MTRRGRSEVSDILHAAAVSEGEADFFLREDTNPTSMPSVVDGQKLCVSLLITVANFSICLDGCVLFFLAANSDFIKTAEEAVEFQNFVICIDMLIVEGASLAHALKLNDFYHDTDHQGEAESKSKATKTSSSVSVEHSRLTTTRCKVIVETEHQVELSFLKTWNSSLKGINGPLIVDKRFWLCSRLIEMEEVAVITYDTEEEYNM